MGNVQDLTEMFSLALEEQNRGNLSHAIHLYLQILEKSPNYPEVFHNLGCIYNEQALFEKACECFHKVSTLLPEFPDAMINLAHAYENLNQMPKALEYYKKALLIDPENHSTLIHIGTILRKFGKDDEALACYEKALELYPNSVMALFNNVSILTKLGLISKATTLCERALKLDPNNPSLITQYKILTKKQDDIETYYTTPNFDECAEQFDHKLKLLKYSAPQFLYESTKKFTSKTNLHILDLGCGTGLCGEVFMPIASRIDGIDLSKRMIKIARKKNIYNNFYQGDLIEVLNTMKSNSIDLITCADVLIYIGNILPLFKECSRVMRPRGLMAFSIEIAPNEEYEILLSNHWGHSIEYATSIISKINCSLLYQQNFPLRKGTQKMIYGHLFLIQKP